MRSGLEPGTRTHVPLEACPLMFSLAPRTTAAITLGLVCCPVALWAAEPLSAQPPVRWTDHFTPEVTVEADFCLVDDSAGTTSAFDLDTVALGMELRAGAWATGRVVVDYDGGKDEIGLDEANITLGGGETQPFFLTAGLLYAPFGDFSTHMIQDPFTQALGEINEEGAVAGWSAHGLTLALFVYDGLDHTNDNQADYGYGASLAYEQENEVRGFRVGGGWVSNLADADTVGGALPCSTDNRIQLDRRVAGLNLHASLRHGSLSLHTEYVAALAGFAADELAWSGTGARPTAWANEVAWTTALKGHETTLALSYQQTREAGALELPEQRLSVSAAVALFAGTTLQFEYAHDSDSGTTSDHCRSFITRLAWAF